MGIYKYLQKLWKKTPPNYKEKILQFRREPVTVRLQYPTRLDRAHALGFKAKQGYFVVRQRVTRGGKMHPRPVGGRRSHNASQKKNINQNYQNVAEQRANKKYPNCEVLNSYSVAKDGTYAWYEVIMVDRSHPVIKADKKINWISNERGRAFKGKTSAAKKSRGLRKKGVGAEKVRPSINANKGRLH